MIDKGSSHSISTVRGKTVVADYELTLDETYERKCQQMIFDLGHLKMEHMASENEWKYNLENGLNVNRSCCITLFK